MDDAVLADIKATETELNKTPRVYIPKDQVGAIMDRLQDGDILALTSTVKGLDVAHTGIAIWKDGSPNSPSVIRSLWGTVCASTSTPISDQ